MIELNDAQVDLFLQLSPLPVWIFDVASNAIIAVNNAALNFYGYSEKEFLQKSAADIFPSEELADLLARLYSPRRTPRPRGVAQRKHDGRSASIPCTAHEVLFRGRSSAIVVVHDASDFLRGETIDGQQKAGAAAVSVPSCRPLNQNNETLGNQTLQGLRVLVIDDDRNTREMLSDILQLYGASVQVAETVRQALQMLIDSRPAVMISDVGMPEEDGFDLIQQLRALPADLGGQTPAIALTGYARPEDKARALALGYQVFMAKPLDLDELVKNIQRLWEP